jgi:hypothetical protein
MLLWCGAMPLLVCDHDVVVNERLNGKYSAYWCSGFVFQGALNGCALSSSHHPVAGITSLGAGEELPIPHLRPNPAFQRVATAIDFPGERGRQGRFQR